MDCYKVFDLVYFVRWQLCLNMMKSCFIWFYEPSANLTFPLVSIVCVWSVHKVFEVV